MEQPNHPSSGDANPHSTQCWNEWKKKLLKSEEKRNALRQAVKLFETQMDKIQAENVKLRQEFEQVKNQVKFEKEAKDKEVTLRQELEKEVNNLKLDFTLTSKDDFIKSTDQYQKQQQQQLETSVLEYEAQIKRLNQLLDNEKKKVELEKKKSITEKNRATEVQKLLEIEKGKVEEEMRLSELNRRKVLENQKAFEKFKQDASEERQKLVAKRDKAVKASKKAEAEKKKANKDIKHAEIERSKLEETMRSLEAERKHANDEKARADHILQQLKLECQKREQLQVEMNRTTSLIKVKEQPICPQDDPCSGRTSTENENVKLLKLKVKLLKQQKKQARIMAKVPEMENDLLRREIYLLKQELVNLSWHLNFLGSYLSQSVKGIADLTKMDKPPVPLEVKVNDESANTTHCHGPPGKNVPSLHKISSRRYKTRKCAGMLSEVGGSLSCPISGINSDLESPIRDSNGKKSQTSVDCSTTASFSDRTFVGSQERGTPAAPTSMKTAVTKWVGYGDISGETTKPSEGKSIGDISNNGRWKYTPRLNPKPDEEHELESRRRPKRRKIDDVPDPVGWTFSEKLKLPMMASKSKELYKPPDNELGISDLQIVFEKNKKSCHERKESKMEENNSVFLCPKDHRNAVVECDDGTNILQEHAQSASQFASRLGIVLDPFCCEKDDIDISHLKEMLNGNLMKFLEFDNVTDEERYRAAVARPLSPTLPILTTSNHLPVNYSHSNKKIIAGYCKNDNDHSLNAADSERDINVVKSCASAPLVIINERILVSEGKNSNKAGVNDKRLSCKVVHPALVSEIKETETFDPKNTSNAHLTDNGSRHKLSSLFCVAYFKCEEEMKILRLFRALEAVIFQSSMISLSDSVLTRLFYCFALLDNLQSMEKASVVFSLLLYHTTSMISEDSKSSFSVNNCVGAFEDELNAGSERFLQMCQMDCLFKAIEHFLIHQEIYIYTDHADLVDKGELNVIGECVDKRNVHISCKKASVNQLVAGSMVLASICKVFNNIMFLWKVSYRILRTFRCNSSSALVMLHTFASVCGEKFFFSAENQFSAIVIKSVVLHLEFTQGSSYLNPAESLFSFPCEKCMFVQGAICLDKILPFLMSKLEHLSRASDVSSNKVEDVVVGTLENTCHDSVLYPDGDCDGSCCILKYMKVTSKSNCVSSDMLCSFVDILSLIELVACFMDWYWICENVVPELLEMTQLCPNEGYAAALVVLIGNLGRVGMDADGYDHIRIAELRNRISKFIDLDTNRDGSLVVQNAAVSVITDLLPLSFKEIVGGERYESLVTSSRIQAENVKSWFSQLTEKQKNMSLYLFERVDETR